MVAKFLALVAGAATVNAYTLTTQLTGNPVLTPNNNGAAEPVIGQKYTITYDGTGLGDVIDLAICQGPGSACNVIDNIALGVKNSNSYDWTVPCTLAATTSNAGYGILLIDDATGQYQYSTQFGLLPDSSGACGSSSASGSASGSATGSATGSAPTGSPTGSRTGKGGSSLTTSTSSGSAPSGTGSSGSGPAGAVNTTSTTYVMPTGPNGGSNPAPTYTPTPGAASSVARCMGGLAAAVLAAVVFLA